MAKSAWGVRPKQQANMVGIVTIITGENQAKLVLQEEGKQFPNGTNTLKVALADLPKAPRLKKNDKEGTDYRIRMSQDGSTVEAIQPVRGQFRAKIVKLGPTQSKDGPPAPIEKVFKEGTKDESRHLEFFASYEITDGVFRGVVLPAMWLHYKFEEDPVNPGFVRYAGDPANPKATRLHQLTNWMETHKLDEELLEWDPDSILPALEERALDNDLTVLVTIDKGYISLVQKDETYEDEPEDEAGEVDEEFPPVEEKAKKPATKKVKKAAADDEDL